MAAVAMDVQKGCCLDTDVRHLTKVTPKKKKIRSSNGYKYHIEIYMHENKAVHWCALDTVFKCNVEMKLAPPKKDLICNYCNIIKHNKTFFSHMAISVC